ncbi:MAG TPA: hypothetical protein VN659_08750 [Pyrinomonadaceae bacterium]|nr:hypothetical protein [Pyrinomonadaceae bacterium]
MDLSRPVDIKQPAATRTYVKPRIKIEFRTAIWLNTTLHAKHYSSRGLTQIGADLRLETARICI